MSECVRRVAGTGLGVRPALLPALLASPPSPVPRPAAHRIVTAVAEEFQWSNVDVLLECGSLYVKQAIADPNHVR